jgi:hypothetical protein
MRFNINSSIFGDTMQRNTPKTNRRFVGNVASTFRFKECAYQEESLNHAGSSATLLPTDTNNQHEKDI